MGADEIDAGKDPLKCAPDVYLLDTSTLLWAIMEPARLSEAARAVWQNPVSYWEIAIKATNWASCWCGSITAPVLTGAAVLAGVATLLFGRL